MIQPEEVPQFVKDAQELRGVAREVIHQRKAELYKQHVRNERQRLRGMEPAEADKTSLE